MTGAAGFIGGALTGRLAALGMTVQGVDVAAGPMPTLHLDVTDGAEVLDTFQRLEPQMVVHCAAIVDDRVGAERCQRVNVGGTENVITAAAAVGVERFVHLSSIAALGLDPGKDADGDTPLVFDTGSAYFDTKAAAEELVRQRHASGAISVVVVRPGDVYGPRCEPWVRRPLRLMRKHMPVLVHGGRGLMAHCWRDNLIDGLVLALTHEQAPGGIFQFHDGSDETTYRTYFEHLAEAAGVKLPATNLPGPLAMTLGAGFEVFAKLFGREVPFTRAAVRYLGRQATYSLESSRQVLGWQPTCDLQEGMERLREELGTG